MNQTGSWLSGLGGGGMLIWAVLAVLVVVAVVFRKLFRRK